MSTPEDAAQPEGAASAAPAAKADIQAMIESVVRMIVDAPDEVFVEAEQEGGRKVFYLEVAPKEIGKLIGKQGRTIRALRNLVEAAGTAQNTRCTLELVEEDDLEDDIDEGTEANGNTSGTEGDAGNQ